MPVPITFRTVGVWGAGNGADLTPAEVDNNFYELKVAVEYIQDNPVQPYQISNVTISGGEATFWLSSGDSFTVALPVVNYSGAPVGMAIADDVYTPVLSDAGKWFEVTGGSTAGDCLITIAPDNEVNFIVGTEMHFAQATVYPIYWLEGSNTDEQVIFLPVDGFNYQSRGRGAVVTVKKIAANTWRIFGALEPVTA